MKNYVLVAEPGSYEVRTVREFDARPERVFEAYLDPLAIPHWWGPAYLTTTVDLLEPRDGGRWRFLQKDPAGPQHNFRGVFHSIRPNLRIVQTFEYEGTPGHVVLQTADFEPTGGGRTRLTISAVFQSVSDRDEMIQAGMESGDSESADRLAALLAANDR